MMKRMFFNGVVVGGIKFYVASDVYGGADRRKKYNYVKMQILQRNLQGHAEPTKPFT